MSAGVGASTDADSVLLEADEHRDHVDLQIISGDPTYLGFGEAAVDATGIALVVATDMARYTVNGNRARKAIHVINAAGLSSVVGYDKP